MLSRLAPLVAACAALCTHAGVALAATPVPTAAGRKEATPLNLPADHPAHQASVGGSGSLVRTFVGLAVVVALIYGLSWVLRQARAAKTERASGVGLASEATIPLGTNRALHLVRAGRELVLVGVAEHGVTPIRTYTEDEALALGLLREPDPDAPALPAAAARPSGLMDRLRDLTTRK